MEKYLTHRVFNHTYLTVYSAALGDLHVIIKFFT
jgi:hypothetical protein